MLSQPDVFKREAVRETNADKLTKRELYSFLTQNAKVFNQAHNRSELIQALDRLQFPLHIASYKIRDKVAAYIARTPEFMYANGMEIKGELLGQTAELAADDIAGD